MIRSGSNYGLREVKQLTQGHTASIVDRDINRPDFPVARGSGVLGYH